eukprot:g39684.t1
MKSLQKISERLDAVRPWRRVDWEPSAPKGNVVRFRAGKNDKHNVNFPCSLIVPLPDYSMFLDVLVEDYEQYRVANSWVEIPDKYINKLVVDIDKCESETERDKNIAVVEDIIINMIKMERFLKPTTDDQVPSILVATRGLNAHIYSNLAITRRDLQEFADAVRPYDRIDDRVATGGSGMRFFFPQKEINATGDLLPDALYKPACFKQLSMDDGKWVLRADLMPSSARELLRYRHPVIFCLDEGVGRDNESQTSQIGAVLGTREEIKFTRKSVLPEPVIAFTTKRYFSGTSISESSSRRGSWRDSNTVAIGMKASLPSDLVVKLSSIYYVLNVMTSRVAPTPHKAETAGGADGKLRVRG